MIKFAPIIVPLLISNSFIYTFLTMQTNIDRFLEAQNNGRYEQALAEIKNGRKESHWIWYIFPQLRGLGYSRRAQYYGIKSRDEAEDYLKNHTLRQRLEEITHALLLHTDKTAETILGGIDALKMRSCMTLFDAISPNDVYAEVLESFYDGVRCKRTLQMLKEE